jgi:hypothetical protein
MRAMCMAAKALSLFCLDSAKEIWALIQAPCHWPTARQRWRLMGKPVSVTIYGREMMLPAEAIQAIFEDVLKQVEKMS